MTAVLALETSATTIVLAAAAATAWSVVALLVVSRLVADRHRTDDGTTEERWRTRPVLGALVVAIAHAVPVAAAITSTALLSRALPRPDGMLETATSWAFLLTVSTLVLFAVGRVARRLLPLAALLKLSMLFPDHAPRRLAIARKAGSVRRLRERLEDASAETPQNAAEQILALVSALHAHDRHTRGHSERVRWYTDLLAEEMRLPQADRDRLRWAALLHDVGKLGVPKGILNKPGKLDGDEWTVIHRHPAEGARLIAPLHDFLGPWAITVEQHHERWDGTGYPNGIAGHEISLGARIVCVADAYEVMTAVRPYKKALGATAARHELTRCAGTHFDPEVVRAFLNVSIGRVRRVAGPVAWVAQVPFVGWVPRVAEGIVAMGGQAVGAAGMAAGAALLGAGIEANVPEDRVVDEVPIVAEERGPEPTVLSQDPIVREPRPAAEEADATGTEDLPGKSGDAPSDNVASENGQVSAGTAPGEPAEPARATEVRPADIGAGLTEPTAPKTSTITAPGLTDVDPPGQLKKPE